MHSIAWIINKLLTKFVIIIFLQIAHVVQFFYK
jgi:hypothetical protein